MLEICNKELRSLVSIQHADSRPFINISRYSSCFFSIYIVECAKFVKNYPEKFSLAAENSKSRVYNTRNKIVHDCDFFVKFK
jgi:hypothetical protein